MLSLGAAEAIDYTLSGLGDTVRRLTPDGLAGLIDAVSRAEAFGPLAALVRDGGRAATTLGAADVEALAARGVTATNIAGSPTTEKLTRSPPGRRGHAARAGPGHVRARGLRGRLAAFAAGTRGKLVMRMA